MALKLETVSIQDYLNYFTPINELQELERLLIAKPIKSQIQSVIEKFALELRGLTLSRELHYDDDFILQLLYRFTSDDSYDHKDFQAYDDYGEVVLNHLHSHTQKFTISLKNVLSRYPGDLELCLNMFQKSFGAWNFEFGLSYCGARMERQRLRYVRNNMITNQDGKTITYTHDSNPITGELYIPSETTSRDELIFITKYNLNKGFINRQKLDVDLTEEEFYKDELSSTQNKFDKLNTEINSQDSPQEWDIKYRGRLRLKVSLIKEQLVNLNKQNETVSVATITDFASIDKHLRPFVDAFKNENEFNNAIASLGQFFNKKLAMPSQSIFIKGKLIRKLSFALGEIWRSHTNDVISYEYLDFSRKLFSNLDKQEIDKSKLQSSNLYKYFISET